ncbi:MAG: LysR family transcriptional regulator [Myxococcota bacterium]|nr:LysR family transcriptional regulator [Myxococcota bacterium]
MNVTLDQLATLEAIHRLGSFAAAGRELGRATSPMTYGIKGLEERLGVTLFDRSGHRAVLTAGGELILSEAKRVIRQVRRLEEVGRELEAGYEPVLSVVLDGILPMPPIMTALREFSGRQLSTRVRLMVEYLSGVRARFETAEAQMMLALDYEGDGDLSAIPLPPVETFLVVHRDHPMSQTEQPLDRAALSDHVELVVVDSVDDRDPGRHRLFLGSPHVFEVSDFHSKREALLSGVGFGWLPLHLAEAHLNSGELQEVPFEEGSRHTLQPHLVVRQSAAAGPACRLFMELLIEAITLR